MSKTKSRVLREVKSIFIIVLIALALRATVIEAYIVPTGSMENTIMTGDFLIGNKFVYGMRTPDWIGIPYTDFGFFVPWVRFPKFKTPQQGDVVIFKYPRDVFQKYVKRLVATPGDTVWIIKRKLFVNGEEFPLPVDASRRSRPLRHDGAMFLRKQGWDRDNFGPVRIPRKGDEIQINAGTDWNYLIPIMLMEGHEVIIQKDGMSRKQFTMDDPNDVARRYSSGLGIKLRKFLTGRNVKPGKISKLYRQYWRPGNPNGKLLNVWSVKLAGDDWNYVKVDGKPLRSLNSYTVAQDYFWMMGDNRDDSADSRYWGFVPRSLILGEAVFTYMSWDFKRGVPRLSRIGKIIS